MTVKEPFKPGNRKYLHAVGRRKGAIATVRLYPKGEGKISINGKELHDYLQDAFLEARAIQSLTLTNMADTHDISVHVLGGGKRGQADAIALGVARALILTDEGYRGILRKEGLLTRDARVKERKKFGLRRARRAPQWSKR